MAKVNVVFSAPQNQDAEALDKKYVEVFRPLIHPLLGAQANENQARKVVSFLDKLSPEEHVRLVWHTLDRIMPQEKRYLARNLVPYFPKHRPRLVK